MRKEKAKIAKMQNRYVQDTQTMKKTRNRRRVALARRLMMLAVILLVVGGGITYAYTKQALVLKQKEEQKAEADKKLADMKKEETELQSSITKLQDDDYIAKLARSEYYLSKDGEIIFNTPTEDENKEESSN
ncbi:FtsB family cell division protein [Listeria costaricensis]|uniref:FtsB family cell division protein n=1 Tax=Listeria costaricensis TaxID=2026604 RepID=UPI000C071E8A|nr:septum formation initiator family protein [Listeria costaricensis]